jgi:hypothetical protein
VIIVEIPDQKRLAVATLPEEEEDALPSRIFI